MAFAATAMGQTNPGGNVPYNPPPPGNKGGGAPTGAATNCLNGTYPGPGLSSTCVVAGVAGQAVAPASVAATTSVNSPNIGGTLYAASFTGADMGIKIANCLVALNAISTFTGTCIANFPGNQTWSVNPFSYAGTAGVNYPIDGQIQICNTTFISQDLPIVMPGGWAIVGCGNAQRGGATVFTANNSGSPRFQATYTTGSVTVGTPGNAEVIAGSGTAFSPYLLGCAFVSPSTQPTQANSTYGIISAVTSGTSITLGFGANNGTGAPTASNFAIYCPMVVLGDGSVGNPPFTYVRGLEHIALNCNDIPGCMGVANWFSEEGTKLEDVNIYGYTNIGYDRETGYAQNSGPDTNLTLLASSSATAGTISYVSRTGGAGKRMLQASTFINASSTNLTQALDIESYSEHLQDLHIENAVNGIMIGGTVSCPVACPIPSGTQVSGPIIENVVAAVTGTTVVTLGAGTVVGASIHGLLRSGGSSWTNALSDLTTSCTETNQSLGFYETTDSSGAIQNSSSITPGCLANPTLGATAIRSFGSNQDSPALSWLGTHNGTNVDWTSCLLGGEGSSANPASFMECYLVTGSSAFQGWEFVPGIFSTPIAGSTGAFTTIAVGGSQALTGVQGTVGTKLPAASGTFTSGNLRSTNSTGDEVDSGVAASTVSRVSNAITSATAGSGISAVTCTTAACTNLRGTYTMTATTVSAGATILTLVWPTTTTAYACLVSQDGGTLAIAPSHSVATATGLAIVSDLAITSGSIGIDYSCQP